MCGIFGMVFHSNKHVEVAVDAALMFSMLATEASVRGYDATGMAIIRDTGVVGHYRNTEPSWNVIGYRRWWAHLQGLETPALAVLGHTRWGTHGPNTIENAHPFLFENDVTRMFVGTHNGQITNHLDFAPTKPFDNDSRNLFHGLSMASKPTWPKMLAQVRGYYALAFATPGEFHLARNYGSPCALAYAPDLDATVYASTPEIITLAAHAATARVGKITHLPVGEIRTYHSGSNTFDRALFRPYEQQAWHRFTSGCRKRPEGIICDRCDEVVPSIRYQTPYGYLCSDCEYELLTSEAKGESLLTEVCVICKAYFLARDAGKTFKFNPRWQAMVCNKCEQESQTGQLQLARVT